MPADEFIRWNAFIGMKAPSGGSKISKFRARLAKGGFYKQTGYRK